MKINPIEAFHARRRAALEQPDGAFTVLPAVQEPATAASGARRKLLATMVDWRTRGKVSAVRDQGQ